ncbi:hypothetical protein ACIBEJ_24825 [Nonomuraea sp. NPDC050790]|uniref:hypothetical protein n=1 Tax=Nonomuraea sp. NPDC050790 TaxID=3364371 RepID=UPI00379D236E
MTNTEQALPADNQWDLLVEHGAGLQLGFHALWVEGDDPAEVARLFRVDEDSRVECDVATLAGTYKGPPAKGIWIGPHTAGWTHLFVFGLSSNHRVFDSLGKRRAFQIKFWGEVGEGLEPLYLHVDGELLGDVNPPYEVGGYMSLPEYRAFTEGLALDPDGDLEHDVHTLWCVVGRITGRFTDRDWWTASRTFYNIPADAWPR